MKQEVVIFVNQVLGKFWTKWFKDYSMIEYLRTILGKVYTWADDYTHDALSSKVIKQDVHGTLSLDYVVIPAFECSYSSKNVKEVGTFDDQLIEHKDIVRYVNIPAKYIKGSVIVDEVLNGKVTWIIGFNASRDDQYVRLYLPDYYDLPSSIRGSGTVPSRYYRLYVYDRTYPIDHSKDLGVLLGVSVTKLSLILRQFSGKVSSFLRQLIWRMYNKGTTIADIKQTLAQCTGNEVCISEDSYMYPWTEGGRYYVATRNTVYSGESAPISIKEGKKVFPGDRLFKDGQLAYAGHMIDIYDLPIISIKSGDETVHLQNTTQNTVIVNGGCTLPVLATEGYYDRLSAFLTEHNLSAPFNLSVSKVNPVYTYMTSVRRDTYMVGVISNYTSLKSTLTDTLLETCKKSLYKGSELEVIAHVSHQKCRMHLTGKASGGITVTGTKLQVAFPLSTVKTMQL